MAYTIKYEHPNYPKGHKFSINGLGVLPNGVEVEITDLMLSKLNAKGKNIEFLANDPHVTVSEGGTPPPVQIDNDNDSQLGGEISG